MEWKRKTGWHFGSPTIVPSEDSMATRLKTDAGQDPRRLGVGRGVGRYQEGNSQEGDHRVSGEVRAVVPIVSGIVLLAISVAVAEFLPIRIAAVVLGILFSAAFSYVVLVAMPRAMQISIMGAALGVTADAGYARLNDQTPITIANALVKLADSMIKGVGLIAADAQVGGISTVTPTFVWAFIISLIFFMGFSFLVDHDG